MSNQVITSFSRAGAEQCGERGVLSHVACWPCPVVVYLDEPMELPAECRATGEIPGWRETAAVLPRTNPLAGKPTNYIWDARRFAVKPFVWLNAAERMDAGILTWLDGDTETVKTVPASLPRMLLGEADVAYLGRGDMHPETGVVVFRIPEALPLLSWCRAMYQEGRFLKVASGWTDCHVLRDGLRSVPIRARDLTSHLAPAWTSKIDACELSPIGSFVVHYKGQQRKREVATWTH